MSQARLITIMIVGMVATVGVATGVNWSLTSSLIASGAFVGATGAQGEPGQDGATGAQGEQGVQGVQGVPGADGLPGGSGSRGATGAQGSGATGPQGAVGPTGAPGADGGAHVPIVAAVAAGTHSFAASTSYGLASVPLDPGVYALTFTLSGAFSVVTAGMNYAGIYCTMSTVGSTVSFWVYSNNSAADYALSSVVSVATATTGNVSCAFVDYFSALTMVDLTWAASSFTAVQLD